MSHVARHVAWWMRRFPSARAHRDDVAQEAAVASWLALADYDAERGALATFAWRRMYSAVRGYLLRAGALRVVGERLALVAVASDEPEERDWDGGTEATVAAAEAWAALVGAYASRGFAPHHAEALARLDVGQTLAEAGAAVGVSRQAVHQLARRAGVHGGSERMAA